MGTTNKHSSKIYHSSESCIFRKTKENFGGLSNMASGFPLLINGKKVLTSEAIYQACRFPHLPHIQEKIINERSPMSAKMVCKPYRKESREDWDDVRIKIMRWCLKVKLAQNFDSFGKLLESTSDKPIVEDSSKDAFWGAIRDKKNPDVLYGVNALGRLLMELRQLYNGNRYSYDLFVVEPLNIPNFNLYGHPIEVIDERNNFITSIKKNLRFETNNKTQIIAAAETLSLSLTKDHNYGSILTNKKGKTDKKTKNKIVNSSKKSSIAPDNQSVLPF